MAENISYLQKARFEYTPKLPSGISGDVKHIKVNFGHDRHFIGNGHRSLLLSDHSSPYMFLRLNTKVWKLNYQNLFVELNTQTPRNTGDTLRQKKFAAFHHLSLNLTRNFNIGIFEGIVFSRNRRVFSPLT